MPGWNSGGQTCRPDIADRALVQKLRSEKVKMTEPDQVIKRLPETADEGRDDETGRFVPGNRWGFKPGESGNPKGRPRGSKSGTAALRRIARQFLDPKTGLSAEELIASKLIAKAIDGDLQAIKEYYDRTEGKPGLRVELETEIMDWRERALMHGLTEEDVYDQARELIESYSGASPSDSDR